MRWALRIRLAFRRLTRRHRRLWLTFRVLYFFLIAFSSVYGFVIAAQLQSDSYDPQAVAVGASAFFAIACTAIVLMSIRMRLMRRHMRKLALHSEHLADRNWELKEAEERASALLESRGDAIVMRNAVAEITYANAAYCRFAGKALNELIGTRFDFVVIEQGASAADAEGTRLQDQLVRTADGPRWIAWRESLVRLDSGRPAEWQSVGHDITARAEAERALARARDQSDAANHAKSRFLAIASHEIRTPLNGILGMSGLLLDTQLSAEQATYARAIRTSGEALTALIDDILDFSKIEADRIALESRPFALAGLVEELTELLAPRAQGKQLAIGCFVDDRLPAQVIGDLARLRQVLLNLAGNAIKFTSRGGVAITVEPGAATDEIAFHVHDTGIGISADARERIFHEFEQADDATARQFGGTGLGLAISERLVKRMGGRLSVESMPDRGSTFSVTLPLPQAAAPLRTAAAPDLKERSVMLVSPQPIEALLIERRLQQWGAQSSIVSDAAVAAALLPERSWDTVLIDYALGAGAVDALLAMAKRDTRRRIVLLTPAERQELDALITAGATGYLVKPVRTTSLAARLVAETTEASSGEPLVPLAPAEPSGIAGLSVLVAEDNDINALLTRSLLTRLGHSAELATTGQAAVERWQAALAAGRPYDIVLMDVQMPDLDGIAATRLIRARESEQGLRRTPIIALTANALVDHRYACLEAGMDSCLLKPLDRDRLNKLLQRFAIEASVAA